MNFASSNRQGRNRARALPPRPRTSDDLGSRGVFSAIHRAFLRVFGHRWQPSTDRIHVRKAKPVTSIVVRL